MFIQRKKFLELRRMTIRLQANMRALRKQNAAFNIFCIPESFSKNISHQIFDYKITFVYSQLENTHPKGDFVLKNQFETFVLMISGIQNKSDSKIYRYYLLISGLGFIPTRLKKTYAAFKKKS